ncbi:hypothetical protein I4F81_002344 [Pyropia yezoensis]|uniref:Uncharacterized protein n=1 Tax=Pyropia yezoensis TaxID=2788 RepID=A0ACC3BPD3_PYRYE|nr:hypothetical protein I4F81_002344 [Neopyropia yezoensis]
MPHLVHDLLPDALFDRTATLLLSASPLSHTTTSFLSCAPVCTLWSPSPERPYTMDTASRLRGLVQSPTTPLSGGTVARLAGLPSPFAGASPVPMMSAAAAALAASIRAGARPPLPAPPLWTVAPAGARHAVHEAFRRGPEAAQSPFPRTDGQPGRTPLPLGAGAAVAQVSSSPRRLRLGARPTIGAFKPAWRGALELSSKAPVSPLGVLPLPTVTGEVTRQPPAWAHASLVGTSSAVTSPSDSVHAPPFELLGSPLGSPPPSPTGTRGGGLGTGRLLLAPSVAHPPPRSPAKRAAAQSSPGSQPAASPTALGVETGRRRRGTRPSVGFRCTHPGCGVVSRFRSYARTHARLHSSELPFECPVDGCSRRFKWASSLGYHKRRHAELEKQARELREFCERF